MITCKARYQRMYTDKYKQDMDFVIIGEYYIGPFIDMDVAQRAVSAINNQFISQPKQRTRTEYEKVTESIFDLKDEFELRVLRHKKSTGAYGVVTSLKMLLAQSENGNLYRKVEKPIEWWEDAAEYVNSNQEFSTLYHETDGELCVTASMTRDQWCDFARILLEQEGE